MVAALASVASGVTTLEDQWYESLLELHSKERCDNVKIVQLYGVAQCRRRPGHYGRHWDDELEMYWD